MTLNEAISLLEKAGVDSPDYDARELFRAFGALNTPLITQSTFSNAPALLEALERRAKREPLQYILGNVGFYREEYRVTSDCLIPRSDTEILVDYAVKNIPSGERFADLCSGSGCIGISTLANTKETSCISVDISQNALNLTLENAKNNGVIDRINTVCIDLLNCDHLPCGKLFAVLSNPPYVREEVYENLSAEIFHEPKIAFVAQKAGLEFYEKLTPMALECLQDRGFIAYEIGYDQANEITRIAHANGCSCEIIKDYSGNDRVAVLKKSTGI